MKEAIREKATGATWVRFWIKRIIISWLDNCSFNSLKVKGLPPLRHLRVNIHCWFSGAPRSAWWVFSFVTFNPSFCGFSFWSPVTCHYMKWTPRTSSRATCSRVRWQRIWEGQWRGRDSRVERIGLVAGWNSFFFFSLFVFACLSMLGPCLSCFKDMFRWFQWYGSWRIWGWL